MQTDLMRRYILDLGLEPKLYKMFLEGHWYPDFSKYSVYLKKMEESNRVFYEVLMKHTLLSKKDIVFESCSSDEENVSQFLARKSILIPSSYGVGKNSWQSEVPLDNIHYIANGVYTNTEDIVDKLIKYGTFTIGIAGDRKQFDSMKQAYDYYRGVLKLKLDKKHLPVQVFQDTVGKEKVYMLHYRSPYNKEEN